MPPELVDDSDDALSKTEKSDLSESESNEDEETDKIVEHFAGATNASKTSDKDYEREGQLHQRDD